MRCGWGGQLAQVLSWTELSPAGWNRCVFFPFFPFPFPPFPPFFFFFFFFFLNVGRGRKHTPGMCTPATVLALRRLAAALCWEPESDPDGCQQLFQREVLLDMTIETPLPMSPLAEPVSALVVLQKQVNADNTMARVI